MYMITSATWGRRSLFSREVGFERDPVPQGLKPAVQEGSYGAAEAAPFQTKSQGEPDQEGRHVADQVAPFQTKIPSSRIEIAPDRSKSKTA
jgi:hypothetical protein